MQVTDSGQSKRRIMVARRDYYACLRLVCAGAIEAVRTIGDSRRLSLDARRRRKLLPQQISIVPALRRSPRYRPNVFYIDQRDRVACHEARSVF